MADLSCTPSARRATSRAERMPLWVLIDFCELAEIANRDKAHAAATHTLAFKRVQRSIRGPTPSSPNCEGRGNHGGNHGPRM